LALISCDEKSVNKDDYEKNESIDTLISTCYKFLGQNNELTKLYANQIYKQSVDQNYHFGVVSFFTSPAE